MAIVLTMLMLTMGLSQAASVSTYSNGQSQAIVELDDPSNYRDDTSGSILLPEGETVNAAAMVVGTQYLEYDNYERYDAHSTGLGSYLWDPQYNGGFTLYSTSNDFSVQDETLALQSLGYNQDFESPVPFTVGPAVNGFQENNWERGMTESGFPIPKCGSGDWCYGTDFDSMNYRNEIGAYTYELTTESIYVWAGKSQASFQSLHNLYYRNAPSSSFYYEDCAYVMVQSSTDGSSWGAFEFLPFDQSNTSGISTGNGMFTRGTSVNQITTKCNKYSFPTGATMIGGTSNNSQTASNAGWATVGLDLSSYETEYVRLKFVLEKNDISDPPVSADLQGWYIDGLRIGDALPSSGSVTFRTFSNTDAQGGESPNGFGFLNMEAEVTGDGQLTVDVLEPGTTNTIADRHGNSMSGLSGSIIELWDIDTGDHAAIDLRFNFNSGANQLNSPELFGFNIGTRYTTGFNTSAMVFGENGYQQPGSWTSSPSSPSGLGISPVWVDESYNPPSERSTFAKPITAIRPIISDDCPANTPAVSLIPSNSAAAGGVGMISLNPGIWNDLTAMTNGFGLLVNYSSVQCEVTGVHADLRFAHHAEEVRLDVAGDGDIEWGIIEPAFGALGEQTQYRTGSVGGVSIGSDTSTVSVTAGGVGQGATFMLPRGADVTNAQIGFMQNQIEDVDIYVAAAAQEEFLNTIADLPQLSPQIISDPLSDFADALNTLLDYDSSVVPTSDVDDFGNEWIQFRMKVSSQNATPGQSITFTDLVVNYDWSRVITDGNYLARELSQGVAMGTATTGNVEVPLTFTSATGGSILLDTLSITTSMGHSSTISLTNGFTGLYDDGNIYEIVTTHSVSAQGQTIAGASLLMESPRGNIELQYTISNDTFWEVSDPVDGIDLSVSVSAPGTSAMQVNWRFRVSSDWDDTESVMIYASSISDSGVIGLPAAASLSPTVGNAVENDAGITDFSVYNQAGVEQTDLMDVKSSQSLVLTGKVRFEDLNNAPDPASYSIVLEELNTSNLESEEWNEVDRRNGFVDGDFTWTPSLPTQTAGARSYRFMMANFTGGDTVCPPSELSPDSDCAIRMQVSMDPLPPQLVNISVMDGANWRELTDNTWIPASSCQTFRVIARDNPIAPETLTLNYWVEKDHDTNLDRIATIDEYAQVPLVRTNALNESEYTIDNQGAACISDIANQGLMNSPLVSLFVSGTDVGGNSVNGAGGPGISFDLVTYQAMESSQPSVTSIRIQDDFGTSLTSANTTMYAGNTYHLRVQGADPNGWGDIAEVRINLNPINAGDMVIHYTPSNDTAWTDSDWIQVLDLVEDGQGAEMRRLDGGILLDPFETQFILDIPIVFEWSVTTLNGVRTPVVEVTDFDPNNGGWTTTSGGAGNYVQKVSYSDDFKLDRSSFTIEDTIGYITPSVGARGSGFVYPGDMLRISGEYAFSQRLSDGIVINPQVPLTLRIEQQQADPDNVKGYVFAPSQIFEYPFENGTFDIQHPAPTQTNEFTFTFSLVGLPSGATDGTQSVDSVFYVNVDSEAPRATQLSSWEISDADSVEIPAGILSSTQFECVSVKAFVEERQRLLEGDIHLNWMYFKDGGNWTEFYQAFPEMSHFSVPMTFSGNNPVRASVNCVNLWNATLPSDLSGVELRFWISGTDSAGNALIGGGTYENAFDGGEFNVVYESASFEIQNVLLSDSTPAVGEAMEIIVTIQNTGNKPGSFSGKVVTVVSGTTQSTTPVNSPVIQPGETTDWRIKMGDFPSPLVNVQYQLVDNETGDVLDESTTFVVSLVSDEQSGFSGAMIGLVALLALILIGIVVAVVVLSGRGGDDEDDYIEDDDFLPQGEAVEPLKSRGPPSRGPPSRGPPTPELTEMERALQEFTFWDENTIQGYFDMGWSIDQLRDWLAEQNQ